MIGRITPRAAIAIVVLMASVLAYGWWSAGSPGNGEGRLARPGNLVDVPPLPDLTRLDASVQEQVRDRHSALANALEGGTATASELGEAFGSYGMLLLAAEYLADAEAAFLGAQAWRPADKRWPYYLGHVHRASQEPARAIPMFERVLALAPDDVPSLIWLGELHLVNGDATAAERYLERAFALRPESAAVVSRLGRAALARRDYARAIDRLERALDLQPDAASVHYPLGMAYRGAGQVARAESHLRQTSAGGSVAPDDPLMDALGGLLRNATAYEARGMEALDARDWGVAVENLRQAVALAPGNAVTRLNLGTALWLSGDTAAGRRELLEAVRLTPEMAKAHFALGVIARDNGRWSEAIEAFSAAVQHDAGLVDAHFMLAETLRRTGRAEESLSHYTRVLQLNPAASHARFGGAMALVRLRRHVEARDQLAEAARLHPDQPGLPHALARLLAASPDPQVRDGALALVLLQPLVKEHRSAALSETMAMVCAELGRFDEAVEWQQRAIVEAREVGQDAVAVRMEENLTLYRRRQPSRTPWRDDDPVHAPEGIGTQS